MKFREGRIKVLGFKSAAWERHQQAKARAKAAREQAGGHGGEKRPANASDSGSDAVEVAELPR